MAIKLLLFDVDSTLVHSHGAGRLALARALHAVYGASGTIEVIPLAGSTDWRAVREALTPTGLSETDIAALWPEFCRRAPLYLELTIAERGLDPCPGALDLLAALQPAVTRHQALLGLVTGNLESTAPVKLRGAGINPAQFRVGGYGSDSGDRNLLPRLAVQRAAALTGHTFVGKEVVVIGDTPADIACGQAVGAATVAVATGPYGVDVLRAAGADWVFEDLRDTAALLAALLPDGQEAVSLAATARALAEGTFA